MQQIKSCVNKILWETSPSYRLLPVPAQALGGLSFLAMYTVFWMLGCNDCGHHPSWREEMELGTGSGRPEKTDTSPGTAMLQP